MKLLTITASLLLATSAASADPAPRAPMKQMLLERFDRNHDGRLEPRERRQAARALRRIARKLAGKGDNARMRQKIIQRYDLNHDGNVDPSEMPPGVARRLQRMDHNRDGWVDDNDF